MQSGRRFPLRVMELFSDVDSEVSVERFLFFGEELVCQRVEAVRAPVESGPFQEVKSRMFDIQMALCTCKNNCEG